MNRISIKTTKQARQQSFDILLFVFSIKQIIITTNLKLLSCKSRSVLTSSKKIFRNSVYDESVFSGVSLVAFYRPILNT